MPRTIAALLVLLAAVALLYGRFGGETPVRALETPNLRPPPALAARPPANNTANADTRAGQDDPAEIRIGSFRRPQSVPRYEVLEEERDEREGARGAYLLVDTRSTSAADYEAITRDVKARYAGLDAVSIEFTDTSTGVLDYNGSALIFNTSAGVTYTGLVYGPFNNRGYVVVAE